MCKKCVLVRTVGFLAIEGFSFRVRMAGSENCELSGVAATRYSRGPRMVDCVKTPQMGLHTESAFYFNDLSQQNDPARGELP